MDLYNVMWGDVQIHFKKYNLHFDNDYIIQTSSTIFEQNDYDLN